jgi:hypothetical protein
LNQLQTEFIFLSGRPVIESLTDNFSLQVCERTQVREKKTQYDLFRGKWKTAVVLGTTMNVSDVWTSDAHRNFLSQWIIEQMKE